MPSRISTRLAVETACPIPSPLTAFTLPLFLSPTPCPLLVPLQVIADGSVQHLLSVGFQHKHPAPFEALQILCFRNPDNSTAIVQEGGLQVLRELLTTHHDDIELVNAICFLLSAMVAFNE